MQNILSQQQQFFDLLDKQVDAYKTLLDQLSQSQDKFNHLLQDYLQRFQTINNKLVQGRQDFSCSQIQIKRNDELYTHSQLHIQFNLRSLLEKQYKYKLTLADALETPLYRDRIFQLRVELKNKSGDLVKNPNKIELVVAIYSQEQYPKEIKVNNKGEQILKGHLCVPLIKGTAFFTRVQIREVSSHYQNGSIILAILPQFKSNDEPINSRDVQPLIVENIKNATFLCMQINDQLQCFGIIISIVIAVILSFIIFIIQSLPNYHGKWTSKHIKNDVKIFRDKLYCIPHIHAKFLKEGYYQLGFVHAQDRFWQLHLRRMTSQGRMTFYWDKYIRNLGYLESCKRIVQKLSEEARIHLQSYADGINDGVKSLSILPIEFKILGV
ncbi:unnamed protein product (macronuclear) [Paramecium tetraurelia]|uniref:Uncharacterized protein n=1 Tax=Paramecium tetraurelia TaxID=5888 RepID=A0DYL0_PARTE|nr:uncharacterized protein GSPATT00003095001 [Paramecium tetraurelia]CAK88127.1 unnamed protein product [Paramecium tetraurelia]|eukprot:XP_001455524.1 hypothetical protein (macronuclear) [Paramecium tetraurelia strain d4-2]